MITNQANTLNDDAASKIRIYPNITSTIIIVENILPNTLLTITNIFGEIVLKDIAEHQRKEIDISQLPVGMYFVNNKKFVKE